MLDQTTRTLTAAWFSYGEGWGGPGTPFPAPTVGPDAPALHIVSAGNFPRRINGVLDPNDSRFVVAPGTAKNVITVGATESYNQQGDAPGCDENNLGFADNPRQVTVFSRTGWSNQRLKPDLVAPGTRTSGWHSVENRPACGGSPCNSNLDGATTNYSWHWGTSFSAPVVTGAAAVASEWLNTLKPMPAPPLVKTPPSPALTKAALIATARSLTTQPACSSGCFPCCATCGEMRPAPDMYQGWGGVSLDRLFRSSAYFIYDQDTVFTSTQPPLPPQAPFTRVLTIVDRTKDINIALVWTDRAGPNFAQADENLQNDLDLTAVMNNGTYNWYGNNFYSSIDSCSRNGYSRKNPFPVTRDRKNNVEKISIKASDIPASATQVTIKVAPFSVEGDGIDPHHNTTFRQDFALFVENARL